MIYAAILAGGKGTRMGKTEMPKQFLMLGTKPIIIHTIESFILVPEIDKVIVITPETWKAHTKDVIKKYIVQNDKIDIVVGGSTRNETIMKGIKYIEENIGISNEDIIITHDAVRPFLNQRIIKDNIKFGLQGFATDTVIPTTDTIIESINHETINAIPLRDILYNGQTPQTFNIKKLVETYNSLTDLQKETLSDACKILVLAGQKVKLVEGEVFNIKITTAHDLKLANAILEIGDNRD